MKCATCGGATEVRDSRPSAKGLAIRRRRMCLDCGKRITTFETEIPARILSRDISIGISGIAESAAKLSRDIEALQEKLNQADELNQRVSDMLPPA